MNKQIAAGAPGGYQLWLRWTLATMIGELAGFAVPAAMGAGAAALMLDQAAMTAALIVAGMGEGPRLDLRSGWRCGALYRLPRAVNGCGPLPWRPGWPG